MARRIPNVNAIALPDNRVYTSTLPIGAGSSSTPGMFYDIASDHNLMLAMNHAQPVHQQQFEGHFIFNTVPWTSRYEITVPKLTAEHHLIRCRVYGSSATGTGQIRFTANTAATTDTVTLAAAVGWQAGATDLDVSASFGVNAYETVLVESINDVNVQVISLEYLELRPLGTYPLADDELPAALPVQNTYPLDIDEVAADKPLPSDVAQTISQGIIDVEERVRVYHNFGDITGNGMLAGGRSYRIVIPVFDLGSDIHTLNWRAKVQQSGTERKHLIQHEPFTSNLKGIELQAAGETTYGYHQEVIPVGAVADIWVEGTVELLSADIVQAPGGYFGFTKIGIIPDTGLLSFTMWGK